MSPRSFASRLAEMVARTPRPQQLAYSITAPRDRVTRLAFSHDGRRLAIPSRDGVVRVHDAVTGEPLVALEGHAAQAMGVAWAPGDAWLASIGGDDELCIWDAACGDLHAAFTCHAGSLTSVAWTSGMLVATSETGCVLRWCDPATADRADPGTAASDPMDLVPIEPLRSPGALHASFSPNGRRLAVAGRGGAVRLWDPWAGTLEAMLDGHADASVVTAWAPDGTRFATGAKDGTCRIWDASRRAAEAVLQTGSAEVRAVAWHPGGGLLATKLLDAVVLWRPDPWRPVGHFLEQGADLGWSTGLAFNSRLPLLATLCHGDLHVRVWELDVERLPQGAIVLPDWSRFGVRRDRTSSQEPRRQRRIVIV